MIGRGKAQKQAARSERLAAALRENLKRRKAQARSRAGQSGLSDKATPRDVDLEPAAPDFRRNRGWKSGDGSDGGNR